MSRTVNRWSKALKLIWKQNSTFNTDKTRLVGRDHLGNEYYEAQRPNHSRPLQRYHSKSKHPGNFEELIETCHVPPAWDAWLRFRRTEPPSDKEVIEGEEYFNMQQEMANNKKKSETSERSSTDGAAFRGPKQRQIPAGAYLQGRQGVRDD